MQPRAAVSRRALLGLAALSVAGCTKHSKHPATTPKSTSPVVPDAAALLSARTGEQRLLAAYDAKIAHAAAKERARLEVARAIHAAHLSALHGAPLPSEQRIRHLPAALRSSAHHLRGLALAAVVGENAALLASIAAAHEASAG
ncbi:MAG TPA: hypothetical protein VHV79_02370 [Mycobacteriales bacterium]|nr:hypothetical protein [Mycobacteriales bacterium]